MTWFPSGLNDASNVELVTAGFTLKVAICQKEISTVYQAHEPAKLKLY
jgi:hypothetical protein